MAEPQSVTNVDISPDEERKTRMIRYSIAMTIRFICIIVGVYVNGWLMWVCFAGAIFLPYFAVVLANARLTGNNKAQKAERVVAKPLRIEANDFKVMPKDD
ncbi:MAG: hypothetical protein RL149_416 [Actinomycetota bacterium]